MWSFTIIISEIAWVVDKILTIKQKALHFYMIKWSNLTFWNNDKFAEISVATYKFEIRAEISGLFVITTHKGAFIIYTHTDMFYRKKDNYDHKSGD